MRSKLFFLILIIFFAPSVFANNIGNTLNPSEYPSSESILPREKINSDTVISGSVAKDFTMNLENCIRVALGNNSQIAAAFQDILIADSRLKQVWSNYFPTLSWDSGYTRIKQLQLSDALNENLIFNYYVLGQISLQQMLYDFGVTQNQATIKKLDYEANKKNFEAVVNDVIYKTKDAYYNVLFAYENRRIAEDTVEKYTMFYNQAKAFFIAGFNPKVDVTIAEVNLSNAKLKLISAENRVNSAVAQLNNIMGVPYLEQYKIDDALKLVPLELSFEEAISIARESRPELKQAELKLEASNQNIKLAKKAFLPKLTVKAQAQRGGKSWNSNYGYNVGGYLTFPVMNMMLIKNQIGEAKLLYDKELANAKFTQDSIYLEIQNSYLKLEEKKNQLPVALLQIKQSKENYDLSYGRYRVGEASPTELKDAENSYETSQLAYYTALYEYNSAKALLERSIGKNLTENLETVDFKAP